MKEDCFRDCLGPLVELASKAGTQLSIKPHRSHAMSRPEQAVWLIEQLNAKGKLSLTFDYNHFAFREMAVEKNVRHRTTSHRLRRGQGCRKATKRGD